MSDLMNFQRTLLKAINQETIEEKNKTIQGLKNNIAAIQQP